MWPRKRFDALSSHEDEPLAFGTSPKWESHDLLAFEAHAPHDGSSSTIRTRAVLPASSAGTAAGGGNSGNNKIGTIGIGGNSGGRGSSAKGGNSGGRGRGERSGSGSQPVKPAKIKTGDDPNLPKALQRSKSDTIRRGKETRAKEGRAWDKARRSTSATLGAFGELELEDGGRPCSEPSDDDFEDLESLPGIVQLTAQRSDEIYGSADAAHSAHGLHGDRSQFFGLGALDGSVALDRTQNRGMFMAELTSTADGTSVHLPVAPVRAAVSAERANGPTVFSDVEVCYVLPWARKNLIGVEDSLGRMQRMWGVGGLVEDLAKSGPAAIAERRKLPPGDRRYPGSIFISRPAPAPSPPQEAINQKGSTGNSGKQQLSFKRGSVATSSSKSAQISRPPSTRPLELFNALTSVDLSNNRIIGCLPSWLLLLPDLKSLDLTGNELSSLPAPANSSAGRRADGQVLPTDSVSTVGPKLRRFSLARNSFDPSEGVPAAVGLLFELRELNLDNFLKQNTSAGTNLGFSDTLWQPLASLSHLNKLSLEGLALGSIPRSVLRACSLENLCLRDCALRELSPELRFLGRTLKRFDVSDNQLKSLDPIGGPGRGPPSAAFPKLEEVVASHNELVDCSLSILSCPHLRRLDLENNELRVFTDLDSFDLGCLDAPPPAEPENSWSSRVMGHATTPPKAARSALRRLEVLVGHNSPDLCPPASAFASAAALGAYLTDLRLVEPFLEKHRKSAEILAASDGALAKLGRLHRRCAAPLVHATVPGPTRSLSASALSASALSAPALSGSALSSSALDAPLDAAASGSTRLFCSATVRLAAAASEDAVLLDFHVVGGEAWPRLAARLRLAAADPSPSPVAATIKALHCNGSVDAVVATEDNGHGLVAGEKKPYIALHGWLAHPGSPVPYTGASLRLNARAIIVELVPAERPSPPPLPTTLVDEPHAVASGRVSSAAPGSFEGRGQAAAAAAAAAGLPDVPAPLSRKKKRQESKQQLKRLNSKPEDDGDDDDDCLEVLSWQVEIEMGDTIALVELQTPVSAQKHRSSAASGSSAQSEAPSVTSAAHAWWNPPAAAVAVPGLRAALAAAAVRHLGLAAEAQVLLRHVASATQRTTLDSDLALAAALVAHAVPSLHRAASAAEAEGAGSSLRSPTPGTPEAPFLDVGRKMKRSSSKVAVADTKASALFAAEAEVRGPFASGSLSPQATAPSDSALAPPWASLKPPPTARPVLACPSPRRGALPPPPDAAFELPFLLGGRSPSPRTPDRGRSSPRSPAERLRPPTPSGRAATPRTPPPAQQVPLRVLAWPAGNNPGSGGIGSSGIGIGAAPTASGGAGHISSTSVVALLGGLCGACRRRGEARLRAQPWDPDVELLAFFCAPKVDGASGAGLDELPLAREIKRLLTAVRPAEVVPAARFPKDVADYLVGSPSGAQQGPQRTYSPRWIAFSGHARAPLDDFSPGLAGGPPVRGFSCPLVFHEYCEKKAHGHDVQWPATPSVDAFVDMLSHCTRLEGVFLNACHTHAYAVDINRRLPEVAVVGWADSPSDQEAYKFSEAFYGALGQQFGRPIEAAFADAVAAYQAFWATKGRAELKRLGKTQIQVPLLVQRKSGHSHDANAVAPPPPPACPLVADSPPSSPPSGLAKVLRAPLPASGAPVPPPLGGWLGDAAPPHARPQPDALAWAPPPARALAAAASEPATRAWTGAPLHWLRDDQKESPAGL